MRPETAIDLARSNSVPLPTSDPTELSRYDSLDGFLRVFWLVQSTLTGRADWARLAYESVIDGAVHGVVHREAFFTPARHLANGQDLADIVAGLDEVLAACLDTLGVERIDHGLPIMDDAELVARMAGDRIALTVCPTSNIVIANAFARLEDHVYPQMRSAGLLATLNTDDPALINLDLGTEYGAVAEAFGWGWQEMVEISLDGVEACWLDDTGKASLRRRITSAATALVPDEP